MSNDTRSTVIQLETSKLELDYRARTMRNVTFCEVGEALGHGLYMDETSLLGLVKLAKMKTNGLKVKFGHTGISETGLGKFLGVGENVRLVGDKLKGDVVFSESSDISPVFSSPPMDYLFACARQDSTHLGMSIVFDFENLVWITKDYIEHEYSASFDPDELLYNLPVVRDVSNFYGVDFVDEPALARDGLSRFSVDWSADGGDDLAYKFYQLVDMGIKDFAKQTGKGVEEATQHAYRFALRYFDHKGVNMNGKIELELDEEQVEEAITDLQEDVEDIQEDVAEIQEDVAEIQEAIEEVVEEVVEDEEEEVVEEMPEDEEHLPDVSLAEELRAVLFEFKEKSDLEFAEKLQDMEDYVSESLAELSEAIDRVILEVKSDIDLIRASVEEQEERKAMNKRAMPKALRPNLSTQVKGMDTGLGGDGIHGNSPLGRDKPTTSGGNGRKFPTF